VPAPTTTPTPAASTISTPTIRGLGLLSSTGGAAAGATNASTADDDREALKDMKRNVYKELKPLDKDLSEAFVLQWLRELQRFVLQYTPNAPDKALQPALRMVKVDRILNKQPSTMAALVESVLDLTPGNPQTRKLRLFQTKFQSKSPELLFGELITRASFTPGVTEEELQQLYFTAMQELLGPLHTRELGRKIENKEFASLLAMHEWWAKEWNAVSTFATIAKNRTAATINTVSEAAGDDDGTAEVATVSAPGKAPTWGQLNDMKNHFNTLSKKMNHLSNETQHLKKVVKKQGNFSETTEIFDADAEASVG
jgi:hypothetical protein